MKAKCVWFLAVALLSAPPGTALAQKAKASPWKDHPVNQWVRQSPRPGQPTPSFGWEGSGAYDPWNRTWIHFGGHDGIPQGFHLFTFRLDTGKWEQHFPNTSPPGVCCVDAAATFDIANHRFVRFPGASFGHGYQWSRGVKLKNSHVWLYDLDSNHWTNMRPPPYRPFLAREGLGSLNASAIYDPIHELSLSFGGQGNSGGTNNLFAYDAYANRLHRLDAANPPSPRDGSGLVYDAKNNCLVMFGSQYANDEKTWTYRFGTGTWEGLAIDPHPIGKKLGTYSTIPRMAYDGWNHVCLCVTWDTNTNQHETWALDVSKKQWTKMNPLTEASPSMSRSRNLDYDAERNLFILETSSKECKGKAPEIWTYRYAKVRTEDFQAPPGNVRVVTDKGKATVTWTEPAGKAPIREYVVYRAEAEEPWKADLNFKTVAVVKGTTFVDNGLLAGKTYVYTVRAVNQDGLESKSSFRTRTQPRVLLKPVVSVVAPAKIEVSWNKHPAADVAGYNVYRGIVVVRSVKKGEQKAWRDNDPEYEDLVPVEVRDITDLRKLNETPLSGTNFNDTQVSLAIKDREPTEYKWKVYAYIVKAVNKLGTESGPSPYALTIPSAPEQVLCRENGELAELKWSPSPEKGIAGYHVYKLGKGHWEIVRITREPSKGTTFSHQGGRNTTRYWIVAVDALGQEGEPSSPVWYRKSYQGFFQGEWHQ